MMTKGAFNIIQTKPRIPRRTYTDEFKNQLVQLYLNGKRKCDIVREYEVSSSLLDKWIKQSNSTSFFKEKDNRTEEELELIKLRKQVKQLEMENDILSPKGNAEAGSVDLRTKINVIKNNTHLSPVNYHKNPLKKVV